MVQKSVVNSACGSSKERFVFTIDLNLGVSSRQVILQKL